MKEIAAFEAKRRFGELLDLVERGEEVIITRRGKVVARLSPPARSLDHEAAAANIRARRRGVTLDGLKIKDLVADGRL